jgi:putative PIN family toxin of toxin-antitoxin system
VRVVLDTNILISAFLFPGGAPEYVYRACIHDRVGLVTSPALLAEFGRVLSEKFGWDPGPVEEAVSQIARIGTVARPKRRLSVIVDDPDEDRVLEAAHAGGVDVIVSGDRHLLDIGQWEGIRILNARDLLAELGIGPEDR